MWDSVWLLLQLCRTQHWDAGVGQGLTDVRGKERESNETQTPSLAVTGAAAALFKPRGMQEAKGMVLRVSEKIPRKRGSGPFSSSFQVALKLFTVQHSGVLHYYFRPPDHHHRSQGNWFHDDLFWGQRVPNWQNSEKGSQMSIELFNSPVCEHTHTH